MKRLFGKKAVITGGSEGIGLGIAKAMAQNGADILLIARNQDKLDRASHELKGYEVDINTLSADLSNTSMIDKLSKGILSKWNSIDILINNAGTAIFAPFSEISEQDYDLQMNLNVKAPYLLTQKLLPALEKSKASVINISSYLARKMISRALSSVYSMTKGAINSLTKELAYELGPKGIRVNAVAPGTVNTPLVQRNINNLSEKDKTRFAESIQSIYPLGRLGEPEDLGGIAVYLASDEAKWVTGAIFNIDGGLTTG